MLLKSIPRLVNNLLYHLLIILIFALIYHSLGRFNGGYGKHNKLSFFDSLYFSLTTHTTIGYGDIAPADTLTRSLVMCHMIILLPLLIRVWHLSAFPI
jgi:hypothetical protein